MRVSTKTRPTAEARLLSLIACNAEERAVAPRPRRPAGATVRRGPGLLLELESVLPLPFVLTPAALAEILRRANALAEGAPLAAALCDVLDQTERLRAHGAEALSLEYGWTGNVHGLRVEATPLRLSAPMPPPADALRRERRRAA